MQACLDRGMPHLPTGVFIVDTPSGGVHVPFIQTDETRKLGSIRNVYPQGSRKPIFELKGNNQGWCAPWQTRSDGGIYKPRDGSAPLMIGMPEEHINWLLANSEAGSTDYKTKGDFRFSQVIRVLLLVGRWCLRALTYSKGAPFYNAIAEVREIFLRQVSS
jgi:hypothetical protein